MDVSVTGVRVTLRLKQLLSIRGKLGDVMSPPAGKRLNEHRTSITMYAKTVWPTIPRDSALECSPGYDDLSTLPQVPGSIPDDQFTQIDSER
jgi:hypothetical protein